MSRRRVELLDTSILVEVLGVPHESSEHEDVLVKLDGKANDGVTLLVSITAVVEAGDHVGNIDDGVARRTCAQRLSNLIAATLDPRRPWKFEPVAWDEPLLRALVEPIFDEVPDLVESLARQYLQMGDLLIVGEFERLRTNLDQRVVDVDVWTKDNKLRGVIDSLKDPGRYRPL